MTTPYHRNPCPRGHEIDNFGIISIKNIYTVNVLYLAYTIFGVPWIFFSVDLIWWLIEIHLFSLYNYTFSCVLDLAENSTTKGAKKNTLPNVIHLQ